MFIHLPLLYRRSIWTHTHSCVCAFCLGYRRWVLTSVFPIFTGAHFPLIANAHCLEIYQNLRILVWVHNQDICFKEVSTPSPPLPHHEDDNVQWMDAVILRAEFHLFINWFRYRPLPRVLFPIMRTFQQERMLDVNAVLLSTLCQDDGLLSREQRWIVLPVFHRSIH